MKGIAYQDAYVNLWLGLITKITAFTSSIVSISIHIIEVKMNLFVNELAIDMREKQR